MAHKPAKRAKRAVVLLSGGLDSAVTLYFAKKRGFRCSCLIFDYGQRHRKEIEAARKLAREARCQYRIMKINFPWKGSSLLDKRAGIRNTEYGIRNKNNIPDTYVPARNIIFLSFALSFAEAIGSRDIFIGAHAQDYSGYPDCRPAFFNAFKKVIASGTKAGVQKKPIRIIIPLLHKNKAQIVQLGGNLGVPFALTWSCYRGRRRPCGTCDSCYFRAKGFKEAGLEDAL